MTDAPPPILTDGVLTGGPEDAHKWDALPRRNRRRRSRGRYPIWLKYLGWIVGLAVFVTATQIAYHAIRSDPRDARVFAERQLRLSALRPDEKVVAEVSVFQRPAIDYFRATRGLLVLTEAPGDSANPIGGRLLYLGLQPRDPLSPEGAPPTFDERDWRLDTAVTVTPTRVFFFLSRAVRVASGREHITVGVPTPASSDADALLAALEARYAKIRAVGWQRREERRARDRAKQTAVHEGRREWYHTVRRGEALSSVARLFHTTEDEIRRLNGLTGDRIRLGQSLRVKGWTKTPVPFPAGVVPDSVP
ncbi:MAG: hypothetical protein JWM95_5412 [Gemmatimonadetes bacterium]|nr:hypothetical protein [Gemmatimonadota bacterium]